MDVRGSKFECGDLLAALRRRQLAKVGTGMARVTGVARAILGL